MHVGIVMGSDSDLPVMKKAAEVLSGFGVTYDMAIASAHRTPKKLEEFILAQEEKGAACFIAGAGMAAALPGVVASMTLRPVIGVPLSGARLDGMDALFSIVQMPSGIPVATVAIDGAKNAAVHRPDFLSDNRGQTVYHKTAALSPVRNRPAARSVNYQVSAFHHRERYFLPYLSRIQTWYPR